MTQGVEQRVWWKRVAWFSQEVDIELLIAGLTLCCFGDYRALPIFRCLGASHGAILGDSRDKIKAIYRGSQPTFLPTYRKDLVGVWYYNLRIMKVSHHPKHIRSKASVQRKMRIFLLKLSWSRSFQCFSRKASRDCLGTKARKLEGTGPI
jgi:hypothetical protein